VAVELEKKIVLSTWEAAMLYTAEKNKFLNRHDSTPSYRASDTYEILSNYLNIAQLYISRVAYLVEAHGRDLNEISQAIFSLMSRFQTTVIKEKALLALTPSYRIIQQLLTSKRDRDTLDVLVSKVTSTRTVLQLRGMKHRNCLKTQAAKLNEDIKQFKNIEKEAMTVRNDVTNQQQQKIHRLLLRRFKTKQLKLRIAEGRGRKLKCEEFPELPALLEFAFGDGDRLQRSGGGLETHPKLYNETMYKASDNVTIMKGALDLV